MINLGHLAVERLIIKPGAEGQNVAPRHRFHEFIPLVRVARIIAEIAIGRIADIRHRKRVRPHRQFIRSGVERFIGRPKTGERRGIRTVFLPDVFRDDKDLRHGRENLREHGGPGCVEGAAIGIDIENRASPTVVRILNFVDQHAGFAPHRHRGLVRR